MSGKTLAAVAVALILASTGWASAKTIKTHTHAPHQYTGLYGYAPIAPSGPPGTPGTTYDAPPYHYGWVPPTSSY